MGGEVIRKTKEYILKTIDFLERDNNHPIVKFTNILTNELIKQTRLLTFGEIYTVIERLEREELEDSDRYWEGRDNEKV